MKNTQKHTQGPWRCVDTSNYAHDYRLLAANGAPLPVNVVANDHSEQRANARLIAAAPDLLAALKQAYDTLGWAQHFLSHANKQAIPDTLEIISAAISKAEGAQ